MKFIFTLIFLVCSSFLYGQFRSVSITGQVKSKESNMPIAYANVVLKNKKDSSFVSGTITDSNGRYKLENIIPGNYFLHFSFFSYRDSMHSIYVGSSSEFLDFGLFYLESKATVLKGFAFRTKADEVNNELDKKTYSVDNNITQSGGSVLQVVQNLPGVSIQDGKLVIRGSDKLIILIDGKQTGLTGFGSQSALDNIPASSVERIEIINNPSAKFDANGNAGIINIILKKYSQKGFNGKVSLNAGLGALWIKKENLPSIRPQFQNTTKLNPSLSLNYRERKINLFFQGDVFYNPTLNKNEFVTRTYDSGLVVQQQTKRNRETTVYTTQFGFDWSINKNNQFTFSNFFSREKILDNGDEPFFNEDLSSRRRLWQFLEDEVKTTYTGSANLNHKFAAVGRELNFSTNFTFHREDERYNFTNILPTYTGLDAFKLLSDEKVAEFKVDYVRPLKQGRIETGLKYRWRDIPTNMQFFPGFNSPLDTGAGGKATYHENVPAAYGNYVFESKKVEIESGLRIEYVDVNYFVNPGHNTYASDGYNYFKPFVNFRFSYKVNSNNRLSVFYNRRVDRPNEFDIRIFPKYDDAEIVKVGNPALRPQYTNTVELAYKHLQKKGYVYLSAYHRASVGTMTRISSIVPGSTVIYTIMQNAGKSSNTGLEAFYTQKISKKFGFNANFNVYQNVIQAFTVENKYPVKNTYKADRQDILSGNAKFNLLFDPNKNISIQLTGIYLAADIIPQGKIARRFSMDFGMKKKINGKSEIFINASDLFNTMVIKKEIQGDGFAYTSSDYYETQVIRFGYSYKF